jgi:hypothetical protein
MKNINLRVLSVFIVLFSCSIQFMNAQNPKVALISVFIDKNLTGDLNDEVLKVLSDDSYFAFDSIAESFKEKFFSTYAPSLPLEFVQEDSIINKPGYKELGLGEMNDNNSKRYATPKSYVYINSRWPSKDKTSIKNAFALLPADLDLVMIAYVNFDMVESGQVGMVTFNKMRAYVNFKIMDRTGKKVVSIKEYGKSQDKTIGVSYAGINFSDMKKLRPLCYQALNKLFLDLKKDLPKDSKKIKKKIVKWKAKNK